MAFARTGAVLLALLLGAIALPDLGTANHPTCTVASVVDGDTFDCTDGTRARLLQINA